MFSALSPDYVQFGPRRKKNPVVMVRFLQPFNDGVEGRTCIYFAHSYLDLEFLPPQPATNVLLFYSFIVVSRILFSGSGSCASDASDIICSM